MYLNSVIKNIFFYCIFCNHEYLSKVCNVTKAKSCKYCSSKILCTDDVCVYCFNKSFASCDKANFWSKKNLKKAREIFKNSNLIFLFDCNVCLHEFSGKPNNIISNFTWCPYCANQKLCLNIDCKLCSDKSFESCEKAKYWSKKNIYMPRQIFKNSTKRVIFDCPECNNEYSAKVYYISYGNWCNCVLRKTEKKLYNRLLKYNFVVTSEVKFDWCINLETKKYLPFDFVIEEYKLIIELDGPQHFKQISNWLKPEIRQDFDIYKMKKAIENKYSILRLLQTDVLNDDNNWEVKLINNIKDYYSPICIYMDNNDEYCVHKKMMQTNNNIDNYCEKIKSLCFPLILLSHQKEIIYFLNKNLDKYETGIDLISYTKNIHLYILLIHKKYDLFFSAVRIIICKIKNDLFFEKIELDKKVIFCLDNSLLITKKYQFKDIVKNMNYGKNISKNKLLENGIPYYASEGVIGYTDKYLYDGEYILYSSNKLSPSLFYVNTKFYPSKDIIVIKFKKTISHIFGYMYLKYCVLWTNYNKNNIAPDKSKLELITIQVPSLFHQTKIIENNSQIQIPKYLNYSKLLQEKIEALNIYIKNLNNHQNNDDN